MSRNTDTHVFFISYNFSAESGVAIGTMLVMRNMVRLFMLLLSTLFASGVYALLSEAVGLDDADNLRKDKTFANVCEYLLMNDL